MADTARASRTVAFRRDAILEAVAFAAEALLLTPDWADAAPEVVTRLGIAADVSRAYVIENTVGQDGIARCQQLLEWCAPGVPSQGANPTLNGAAWSEIGFGRWLEEMSAGRTIHGSVRDFPASERAELASQRIVSLASFPIFVAQGWWGCIGFDDCVGDRDWAGAELEALRAAAGVLGAAISRSRSEAQALAAESRYRTFVEQIPAITYTDVAEGTDLAHVGFVSPQIEAVLGYPAQRFLDDPNFWFDITHPDDRDRVETAGTRAHAGAAFDEEYRMIAADGRVVWFHDTSRPVLGGDGSIRYWQGFMVDITQRKLAEEAVRLAEERYRALVERLPVVMYIEGVKEGTTVASELPYMSPQVEVLLGYPVRRWTDTQDFYLEIMHPEDRERVLEAVGRADANGEPLDVEYRMNAADGRTVWVQERARIERNELGDPLYWQGFMLDVTERKEAERGLRVAEEKFRLIVEGTPAITYQEAPLASDSDAFTPLTYVSPQLQTILGYSPEQWSDDPDFWATRVHPDDYDAVQEEGERSALSGEPYRQEYRMIASDGRVVWFHDESILVRDADGSPLVWQGLMLDITERKEAEERLRAAEERYRALVEHLPAVVYIESRDADPNKFYLSPQVESVFGYTVDEWTWTPNFWVDRVHPADVERSLVQDRIANETLDAYSIEYRFRRADGSWIWVRDEATFLKDEGTEGFWQGFLLDVTEQKEAEEQVRAAEEQFRTIVEQNPAIIYTQSIDPDAPELSKTTYISPASEELTGYALEETLSNPMVWREWVHPDDLELVAEADAETNRTGEPFSMEYRMIRKDGRVIWVQDEAALVHIRDRDPYWQGFLMDVTERKEAEARLARALDVEREATRRLRALDDMKNTFLQAVSHDLRTPLAAILGLAVTLERGDVHLDEHDSKDLARRIAENSRKLDRLVTNLLDLDRLARGIVEPKLHPTDAGALVRRALSESELLASSRVEMDIDEVIVSVDGAKIERIVENLLANTLRHTPEDTTVWVRVKAMDDGVLIVVEDDGAGVPEEIREAIFEPFLQGPDAPQHSPGVGVGLALVSRFAELHGGRAWVEEREGGGASFRVWIPDGAPKQQRLAVEGR